MSAFDRLNIDIANKATSCVPSQSQEQTKDAFGYKWAKRDTYESEAVKSAARAWLFERYCGNDPCLLNNWLSGERKIILDAGCGSGFSALLFFGDHLREHDYLGVDISSAAEVAKKRFAEKGYPGDFLQTSLLDLPVPDGSIDLIFSEGVLHHTDSTEAALKYLAAKLRSGGRFLFYVYKRKAAIREYTDDLIRHHLQGLSDEDAWRELEPLTRLGIALGELKVEIDVPEDIPYLGIQKGKMDLQRFFYWNLCKAYYRPDFTIEEMNHVNFDWFRPLNCQRHTPEEIQQWCGEAGLAVEHMDVQEAGITVVAVKG